VRPLTEDEGGSYLIEFPDLPGCMADGETIEKAIANGADAQRGWIAAVKAMGHPVRAHKGHGWGPDSSDGRPG
jgi:antitoxin HicB